jgi:hypothetical protein
VTPAVSALFGSVIGGGTIGRLGPDTGGLIGGRATGGSGRGPEAGGMIRPQAARMRSSASAAKLRPRRVIGG